VGPGPGDDHCGAPGGPGFTWLEEPLDQFDYAGYRALRERTSIPLAAGEMLSDYHGFRPGWVPEARDAMLTEPLRIDADGFLPLPHGPGLGVELNEDRIAAHCEEL